MKRISIVPQRATVAASPALIFDLLGAGDSGSRPDASLSLSLISREGPRTLVAFSTRNDWAQPTIIKEMTLEPPSRARYRHLDGAFPGATENLELRPAGATTDLLLTASFEVREDDDAYRLRKVRFERAAREHLLELKYVAEKRTGPQRAAQDSAPIVLLPSITTEQELLKAVEAQEESEWGHVGHGRGVARVAVSLAEAALLPARQVESIRRAALLHDAGKLAVDSELWGMRGTLTPEQRARMEVHSRLGYDLAARAGLPELVLVSILHHHERWDGRGYPGKLAGEQIPLKGRILFMAEAIDTMMRMSYRRPPLSIDQVIATLEAGAGHRWDPTLARKAAQIIRGR